MPKISLLIPVYNVEKYLKDCLDSAIKQTESDIEIICVEDGSTDGSKAILTRYEHEYKNIIVINHEANEGTSVSRKDAVDRASGEYLMFLDSDDYLSEDACEKLYSRITEANVDILQFGTNVIVNENVSADMKNWVENFLTPYEGRLENCNLIRECFCKETFDFNLTNKVWRASPCKKAFARIDAGKYIASEDRYAVFILLYYMKSFMGIRDKYYNYRLGIGVTGGTSLDLVRFEKRCSGAWVSEGIRQFLDEEGIREAYKEEEQRFGNLILWDCVDCWYNKLTAENYAQGYSILAKYWDASEIVGAIGRTYFEQQEEIIERKNSSSKLNAAIYYRYIGYDVMDKVLIKYADLYRRLGYDILLITDYDAPEQSSEYNGIKLVHVPSATEANWDQYYARSKALACAMKDNGVSSCRYLSPTSHVMLLDWLLLETMHIEVAVEMDEYCIDYYENQKKHENDMWNQKYGDLLSQYNEVTDRYNMVENQCNKITDQYNAITDRYNAIINTRWYKMVMGIKKLLRR